jgi:hypothetical protein
LRKIDTRSICTKLDTQVSSKESRSLTNDVVQNEESKCLGDEPNFFFGQREDLVIGRKELEELGFMESVRRVRPLSSISCLRGDAGQEVEVQNARLEPEPVVIPSREETKGLLLRRVESHREVAEIPIDKDRNSVPRVVPNSLQFEKKVMSVPPQNAHILGW